MLTKSLLASLQNKQNDLDSYIFKKWQLNRVDTYQKRKLAFLVELAEFINEQRDFKFWSQKPASPEPILLDEYIDGLHFLLSLSIDLKIDFADFIWPDHYEQMNNLTNCFLTIYDKFITFTKTNSVNDFADTFGYFLKLGDYLNFSEEKIIMAYQQKNEKNFIRQNHNY